MRDLLYDDAQDCIRELEGWVADNWPVDRHDSRLGDFITEQADQTVPCYTADLLEAAAHNVDLASREPDCGPAFDGTPTPVNIIAANYYELLEEAMWEEVDRIIRETEEDHTCEECQEVVDEDLIGGRCLVCREEEDEEEVDDGDSES